MISPLPPELLGFEPIDELCWRKAIRGRLVEFRELRTLDELGLAERLQREVMALSDVIHVIYEGRLSPAFPRGTMTPVDLGGWMAGHGFAEGADAA